MRKIAKPVVPDTPATWDVEGERYSGASMTAHEEDEPIPHAGQGDEWACNITYKPDENEKGDGESSDKKD